MRKATVRDWDIEAGRIHRAVKSFRISGDDIITLLAHFKNRGRQRIRAAYKKVYEEVCIFFLISLKLNIASVQEALQILSTDNFLWLLASIF